MLEKKDISRFLKSGQDEYLPQLSIDCVLFGYHQHQLKVLLLKAYRSDKWTLPGGFIKNQEDLEAAAQRILYERTGLSNIFLQQFQTFGEPNRSDRTKKDIANLEALVEFKLSQNHWLFKRTVSIGYYAVTEYSKVTPVADAFSDGCEWCDINEIPAMIFDHALMILEALKALRKNIYHQPIGYNLLPEKFTIPEIHDLYETILGKTIDQRNFVKKLNTLGLIKKLNEQRNIGPHRSPFLYKFDKRKYDKALKEGIVLAF